jgi:hypothetical protein
MELCSGSPRGRVGRVLVCGANVSNEASTLVTMYQTQMRELPRKYAKAVAGPEWENAIRTGIGTESARDALNEMYRVLGNEQSSVASGPISQKFLDQLTTLASERNQRILDAKPRTPGLLWTGVFSAVSYCWGSAASCGWAAYVRI